MIHLSFNPNSPPLYQQIYQQYKQQIYQGIWKAHERLPSKRTLAAELGVSITTVDTAYAQLVSEGFIQPLPKKGFFVCPLETLTQRQPRVIEPYSEKTEEKTVLVDFSTDGIDEIHFPYNTWRRIMKNVFNEYDKTLLKRTSSQGSEELREAISKYLYEARGVNCRQEQIVVGAGVDNLLQILSYILDKSWTIAMENPVYNRAYQMFNRMGHKVLPVDIDGEGIPVEPLQERNRVAVYITPSHQFPLGISMPIGRRVRLLNWAKSHKERYIIEDDYDSEFRYNTKPLPSLQSIDTHGRVIYLGSFSKSIAPSLRISFMVLPDSLLHIYRQDYGVFSSPVSGFEQKVLNEFIRQGHFERHLNKMRLLYKNKRALMDEELRAFDGKIQVSGESAGHHLLVRLNAGMSEAEMCRSALENGVRVYPISPYFVGKMPCQYEGNVLLGYGALSHEEIRLGIALLKKAWLQ
ncbi:MocR-like pyridoxine biosynthesis transcription factor PdxR [Anaeropeptidivorans aminofermentans]|jgi:GntR family transcriptional regulator/MocR family aminotransferase|uniref:MocR-like pyridoxine biosynthesis transcription factor PdxR n=1 Tax=Anaeropeptidivorans aminofermentans TaxID=2934315 RepID=UPI0020254CC1|nr:PLP-dependent aminotransferase family protein [Anaeropeptidivorans aminofermentans]